MAVILYVPAKGNNINLMANCSSQSLTGSSVDQLPAGALTNFWVDSENNVRVAQNCSASSPTDPYLQAHTEALDTAYTTTSSSTPSSNLQYLPSNQQDAINNNQDLSLDCGLGCNICPRANNPQGQCSGCLPGWTLSKGRCKRGESNIAIPPSTCPV